jgi:hypothetical protein
MGQTRWEPPPPPPPSPNPPSSRECFLPVRRPGTRLRSALARWCDATGLGALQLLHHCRTDSGDPLKSGLQPRQRAVSELGPTNRTERFAPGCRKRGVMGVSCSRPIPAGVWEGEAVDTDLPDVWEHEGCRRRFPDVWEPGCLAFLLLPSSGFNCRICTLVLCESKCTVQVYVRRHVLLYIQYLQP